jgi:hypothetical protein
MVKCLNFNCESEHWHYLIVVVLSIYNIKTLVTYQVTNDHGLSCLHKLNTSIVQSIQLKRGFIIQNKNNNKYCIDILALYSNYTQ